MRQIAYSRYRTATKALAAQIEKACIAARFLKPWWRGRNRTANTGISIGNPSSGLLKQRAQQILPQRRACLNLLEHFAKLCRNLRSMGVSVSTMQKSLKVAFPLLQGCIG
jgi:hypothetical protein